MTALRLRSLRCSDEDWAEIRFRAQASGQTMTAFLLARALSDEPAALRHLRSERDALKKRLENIQALASDPH